MLRGNQHGGREYDDLQNWLDMMPHETFYCVIFSVLYYVNTLII